MKIDTWLVSGDQTLGPASGRYDWSVWSPRSVPNEGVQRLYFMGLLFKPHGQLKLILLYIFIDIATL